MPAPTVLLAGDHESAVLYDALAYDVLTGRDEKPLKVFRGLNPIEVDEMELWQIAHVMGVTGRVAEVPPVPEDYEERQQKYAEALERRRIARESKKGKGK